MVPAGEGRGPENRVCGSAYPKLGSQVRFQGTEAASQKYSPPTSKACAREPSLPWCSGDGADGPGEQQRTMHLNGSDTSEHSNGDSWSQFCTRPGPARQLPPLQGTVINNLSPLFLTHTPRHPHFPTWLIIRTAHACSAPAQGFLSSPGREPSTGVGKAHGKQRTPGV